MIELSAFQGQETLIAGIGVIITAVTLTLTAAATAYAIITGLKGNKDAMGPESEDFKPTLVKEGSVIAWICGRVRMPASLVWHGNMTTEEIEQKTGGKGLGGQPAGASGYRMYTDAWQAICWGKANIIKTYINDAEGTVTASDIQTSDGTSTTFPAVATNMNSMLGVAWWFADRWYLGDNTNSMPTIHFVMERVLETPLNYQNMANGSNPAAVIYDILIQGGIEPGKIDIPSFQAASTFWNDAEIALNLIFNRQDDVAKIIGKVLNYIDAVFYVNQAGKYALRAIDPTDTYIAEIDEQVMDDFSINRRGWRQVPNDFHGTFIEETNDFTQRVVVAQNPAAIRLAGNKIKNSIDLKCFRDVTTASQRLYELMKRQSYPALTAKWKASLKYSTLLPGDVIRISNSDYGIEQADFRIESIDAAALDRNEVKFTAVQQIETLFDDIFVEAGGSDWEDPDTDPVDLTYKRIYEIPYNTRTAYEQAFMVLAARENLSETNFFVYASNDEFQDYELLGDFTTWSQRGTLDEEYDSDTFAIDNDCGINFTAYKEDPIFDTISRAQLFSLPRVALIGDELLAFETVTPLGGNQFRLSGVIRNIMGTLRDTHASASEIWITYFSNNIIEQITWETFYVKVVPAFLDKVLPLGSVSAIEVTKNYTSKKPWDVARIVAVRTGSNIAIQLWPRTPGFPGAGVDPPGVTDKEPPFVFGGDFQVEYGATTEIQTADSFVVVNAGAVDITVKSRFNNFISAGVTVSVGATDGTYKASFGG